MDIDLRMSQTDASMTRLQVDALNKELGGGKAYKPDLDKDDFLKILITQLQHQDPTNPMQDKEFIAQMAQFSSLEQMTNMATSFGKLSSVLNSSEAQSLLGRTVEVIDGENAIYGKVSQVVRGEFPLVMVNGSFYDLEQVSKVEE
ncbi:MAG: flagellar hook assembly protein FlgD [Spirochaetia bacterium]|jgi:flagellar basal-body rod modification protein FlgD|nr:flagellar hook assembly protein FlgD [Spirochaetia bacterium]